MVSGVLLGLGAVLSGCSPGSQTAGAEGANATPTIRTEPTPLASWTWKGHPAQFLGRPQGQYEFPNRDVVIAPAEQTTGEISWQDAFKACVSGTPGCVTHEDASITLVDATIMGTDGLMYAIAWNPTDCLSMWPTTEYKPGDICRQVDLITASQTGDLGPGEKLYTFVVLAEDARGL